MSSRKALPVTLSPKARQDIVEILRYTGKTWGARQLAAYHDKLDAALRLIGENPHSGHTRSDLPLDMRAYLVESHIVVYRVAADRVGVVRILHQRMSLFRHV